MSNFSINGISSDGYRYTGKLPQEIKPFKSIYGTMQNRATSKVANAINNNLKEQYDINKDGRFNTKELKTIADVLKVDPSLLEQSLQAGEKYGEDFGIGHLLVFADYDIADGAKNHDLDGKWSEGHLEKVCKLVVDPYVFIDGTKTATNETKTPETEGLNTESESKMAEIPLAKKTNTSKLKIAQTNKGSENIINCSDLVFTYGLDKKTAETLKEVTKWQKKKGKTEKETVEMILKGAKSYCEYEAIPIANKDIKEEDRTSFDEAVIKIINSQKSAMRNENDPNTIRAKKKAEKEEARKEKQEARIAKYGDVRAMLGF